MRLARHEHLAVGLGQQALDRLFGLAVLALAEMDVAQAALGVDQVVRRPVMVLEALPQLGVIIDGHRIGDAEILDRLAHIGRVALEGELGGVDANDDEPLAAIGGVPRLDIGQ